MNLKLEQAARACGGTLVRGDPDAEFSGGSADSRHVSAGQMFVAIGGEHLDGHDFVAEAFRRGASVALVEREVANSGPLIVVDDTVRAVGAIAAMVRDLADPIVVGITGSSGKTTTKDFLHAIVSRKYSTVASPLSYNTEITLPLTVLSVGRHTEVLVCEMGSRGPGQIEQLCRIARPQVGVVTNVGVTHHEQFGSREAIAESKGELVRGLPASGTAVLNGDDSLVEAMEAWTSANVMFFGDSPRSHLTATRVSFDRYGRPTFRIAHSSEGTWVTMSASGRHQVANALAASTAALALGLSLEDCRAGLESAVPSPWRMQVHEAGGVVVVNDAYNANPDSVASALATCAAMVGKGGRLVAILGYMAELGEIEESEHERVGKLAAESADRLVVVSTKAAAIARGASAAGLSQLTIVENGDDTIDAIGEPAPGDVVLVKGSRIAGLEDVAAKILDRLHRR